MFLNVFPIALLLFNTFLYVAFAKHPLVLQTFLLCYNVAYFLLTSHTRVSGTQYTVYWTGNLCFGLNDQHFNTLYTGREICASV